jgi:D-glycero-D-manno-heptose 1,7-bisphosphate phosphatase
MIAVILAGGKGSRLAPVTNFLPKALVPINGSPILKHQFDQLRRIGISKAIVLTGYLSSSIKDFCKTYSGELEITCIETNSDWTPADRILASESIIGTEFFLIYCDNYVTNDEDLQSILTSNSELTFLIESRDKGNVKLDLNQRAYYLAGARKQSHNYVELGNIYIKTERFYDELRNTRDLPKTLQLFSEKYPCGYKIAKDSIISLSSFENYKKIVADRKIILLDRDGILLEKMPAREYLTKFSDYVPIYHNWSVLREISQLGIDFIIATNQPGIATGQVSEVFLQQLHTKLTSELTSYGINVLSIYVCKHHWDAGCNCRKPKAGMLIEAMEKFAINSNDTLYVGDEEKDSTAAVNAGIDYVLISRESKDKFAFTDLVHAKSTILSKILKID